MNSSEDLQQVTQKPQLKTSGPVAQKKPLEIDFKKELEKVALFVAQAWRDDHPNIYPASEADVECCIAYVTAEMGKAAAVVGGPVGLEILTGGGSAAACVVCKRVLSSPYEHPYEES